MNSGIIFVRSAADAELAYGELLGKTLVQRTVDEMKKAGLEKVYIVTKETVEADDAVTVKTVDDITDLDETGKCILTSPFYPLVNKDDYEKILEVDEGGAVAANGEETYDIFMVPAKDLKNYENIPYTPVEVDKDRVLKIGDEEFEEVEELSMEEAERLREQAILKEDVRVFALTSSNDLVDEICTYLGIPVSKMDVTHFADGETLVEYGDSIRGKKVFVIQSTCAPVNERLMELLIALNALKLGSADSIVAIIPYFGYARQDRKAKAHQPITAKLVADLLGTAGASRVVTFDLHAAQIAGFFNFPVDDMTCIPMMGQYFLARTDMDLEDLVVVSPDHGGVNRARKMADILKAPIAIVDKRRPRPNEVEVKNIIGDVAGKNCILVDDICDTGRSLIAAADLLKEFGAKDIYVSLSHGVFSGNAMERLEESCIKEVVVSNSIPLSKKNKEKTSKITILSVGYMLAELIKAIVFHKSVGAVYNMFNPEKK